MNTESQAMNIPACSALCLSIGQCSFSSVNKDFKLDETTRPLDND